MASAALEQDRKTVLFACTLNCIRSPMAAAMLDHLAARNYRVLSAGVKSGILDPYAVAVMDEIGIDISEHEPQTLEAVKDEVFDLIISLSPEAHHHALEFTRTMAVEVEYWPTVDCSLALTKPKRELIAAAYREVRDQMFERVRERFAPVSAPTV